MTHKTKTIILVIIILLASILALGYFLNINKEKSATSDLQAQSKVQNTDIPQNSNQNSENKNYQQTQPNIKTTSINGKVVQVTKDSIIVLNGGVKNTFTITDKVFVVSINPKNSGTKTITDVKKDDNVSVVINTADSQVVGIQIN
jgi:uncharacterized protein (UPF0333 family)